MLGEDLKRDNLAKQIEIDFRRKIKMKKFVKIALALVLAIGLMVPIAAFASSVTPTLIDP